MRIPYNPARGWQWRLRSGRRRRCSEPGNSFEWSCRGATSWIKGLPTLHMRATRIHVTVVRTSYTRVVHMTPICWCPLFHRAMLHRRRPGRAWLASGMRRSGLSGFARRRRITGLLAHRHCGGTVAGRLLGLQQLLDDPGLGAGVARDDLQAMEHLLGRILRAQYLCPTDYGAERRAQVVRELGRGQVFVFFRATDIVLGSFLHAQQLDPLLERGPAGAGADGDAQGRGARKGL